MKNLKKIIITSLTLGCFLFQNISAMASENNFNIYYYKRVNIDKYYMGTDKKTSEKHFASFNFKATNTKTITNNTKKATTTNKTTSVKSAPIIKNIKGPMSPSYRLGLNASQLTLIINKAFPKNKLIKDNNPLLTQGFVETLVRLENELGINPFFILGIIHAENPIMNGKFSKIVAKKNNLMSWTAYDNDPFNNAKKFDNYSAAIIRPATFLAKDYLNPSGKYYVDGTVQGINKYYATAKNWYKNVNFGIKKLNDTRISLGF